MFKKIKNDLLTFAIFINIILKKKYLLKLKPTDNQIYTVRLSKIIP